jgi:hypothetical protein
LYKIPILSQPVWDSNTFRLLRIKILLILCISIFPFGINAQTTSYNQFWNEFQFTRALGDKWSSEINLGGAFSSTPSENRIFKTNIQRTARIWAHYYFSPRWKLSTFLAYYYNKDVPEIGQFKAPEWRYALQGIYYFHKTGYTLSTRMRAELRFIRTEDGVYEDVYRYRQQLKFLKPINSQFLRKGVFYLVTADEVFFKSNAKTTGLNFFDRNRFTLGAGYIITDDLQLELAYANEFLPRDNGNQIIHALSLAITFNNLLPKIRKKLTAKPAEVIQED